MSDVQAAAPSAATETSKAPNGFESGKLTKEISETWMKGQQVQIEPKIEDSATSQEASEGKPESVPAAESGKEKQDKGQKRKLSAEERIEQLEGTIKKIREEAGKKAASETRTAEPSTAKPVEQPKALEEPKEPKIDDFADFAEYDAALRKFYRDLAKYESAKAIQEDRALRAHQAQQQAIDQQVKKAQERYPDFSEKAGPALKGIMEDTAIHPVIRETIGASPVFTDILYTIGADAETVTKFIELAKTDGIQAIKYIGRLEDLIMQELDKGKEEKAEKKEPPAKTATSEPPARETRTVGTRGTGPDDPAADAVRRSNGKLTREVSEAWMRKYAGRT